MTSRAIRRGLSAVAAALVALLVYATLIEPYRVRLEEVDVALAGLPEALAGLRILQLSDLESRGHGSRERQVAALGREASADVVIITGDLVSKRLGAAARAAVAREIGALVGNLPSRLGTWLVEGHGERTDPVARRILLDTVRQHGVRYLGDDVEAVPVGNAVLALVGLRVRGFVDRPSFRINRDGSLIQRGGAGPGAHLVFDPSGSPFPRSYAFTGEFRFSREEAGIGVTFNNRLLEREDRFHRMRRLGGGGVMQLSPHGTVFSRGRSASEVSPSPGEWYRFHVSVEDREESTHVRARVWPAGRAEPVEWDIDCVDETPHRIRSGSVGVWTSGPGEKEFRRLRVEDPQGRTVMAATLQGEGRPARWRGPEAPEEILAVSAKIPPGAFPIALAHSPDAFLHTSSLGWPLLLSGHTQGGQVRLPFIGALTTDTVLGRKHSAGLFIRDGSKLYITRGIGTSRIPIRFLSPPELTLITLRREPAARESSP